MRKAMDVLELKVDGMTCGSCVKAATRALSAVPGVEAVDVQLERGAATVRGEAIEGQAGALLAALRAAGYEAQLAGARAAVAPAPKLRGGCGSNPASGGGCCCGH